MGISFILSAYATSVGFLCLSAGFLVSIGLAMTYVPTIFIVTYYFEKRRGLALALACTGSGLGAFAFPPLLQYLMTEYSWRGTLLIFGGISFNITAAGLLYRPVEMKMKQRDDKEKQINEAENVDVNPAEQINVISSPDTAESHERHTSTVQQNSACNQLIEFSIGLDTNN